MTSSPTSPPPSHKYIVLYTVISTEQYTVISTEQYTVISTERSEWRNPQTTMYNTYYIYIMSNQNDTVLYIGVTNNIERRIQEHKSGLIPGFTQKYNCDKLVYLETYSDINQALDREKQLKKWRREKKDWLIKRQNPEYVDLSGGFLDSLRSLEMTR